MENGKGLLGCFLSYPTLLYDASEKEERDAKSKGDLFRTYVWGERGVDSVFKRFDFTKYGEDLILILFKFKVNPIENELAIIKKIDGYTRKEKAISVTVIVLDENFFERTESERYLFLKNEIIDRVDLVVEVVKKKKLDTKFTLLKNDLVEELNRFTNKLDLKN